jgi:hypothetical protein
LGIQTINAVLHLPAIQSFRPMLKSGRNILNGPERFPKNDSQWMVLRYDRRPI